MTSTGYQRINLDETTDIKTLERQLELVKKEVLMLDAQKRQEIPKEQRLQRQLDAGGKELAQLQNQLVEENDRVAKLKLQSELRDQELKLAKLDLEAQSQSTKTVLEGNLFKFGKRGRAKPKMKRVWFHVLRDLTPMLDWADTKTSGKVERAIIKRVYEDNDSKVSAIPMYKDKTFCVETNRDKVLIFRAESTDERRKWVQAIETHITAFLNSQGAGVSAKEAATEIFEITFENRPLGFGIDQDADGQLYVSSIQNDLVKDEEGLAEKDLVLSCNGQSFLPNQYEANIQILRDAKPPITVRFAGNRVQDEAADSTTKHSRDLSMQDLYPTATLAENSIDNHPLVLENPEFKEMLKNDEFYRLVKDLMEQPEKLTAFLADHEL